MVLLLLSAHTLDLTENASSNVYDWYQSQRVVYAAVSKRPIFGGLNNMEVDTDWALHLINFFRGHMLPLVGSTSTMYPYFAELAPNERPQMWNGKLSNSPDQIGKWWKGTYAYIEQDEVVWIRNKTTWNRIFQDKNVDEEDSIQMVRFSVPEPNSIEPWNPLFEKHLKSTTKWDYMKNPLRPQHHSDSHCEPQVDEGDTRRSYRFEGLGYDDEKFYASGWINPIASQRGVPGWSRMSMMKYFKDPDGSLDQNAFWAYEGVVLPGGNMIVGRWWAADPAKSPEDQYSGPFLLWNIDASEPKPSVSLKSS
jgi:hypothetical protein